ncbi:ABC transporter ATP-binding protein [Actibacterium mucosum KCTC 23349]|uniref:ABC transporter ATP-binding protein n=1 Tax=Actibacterium mucosum KCTC 23349 TaxID=1454373 RepID=A0A037ZFS6_9RHOB|nr:ABC transporter ATP-binding protein [Actibacterium mucosum]KAJ54443.1 ABC transporter ATP-binding protein [Actibacterium mucosum KCTC 23349]
MADLEIRGVSVAYGALTVLEELNLTVPDEEFLVLLGPSGCGKSTLLNAIAGLQDISTGQVVIGGKNVTWAEPSARGIAMVFQSYALYPRMSVYRNLAYSLQVARLPRAEIEDRVHRAAEMLQITELLERKPAMLSGGQRQRVAIGRALVRDASVFLFDEPLSNLDAQLRVELRVEIKRLHRELKRTMIYVTHDQVEAMTLADKIAVLKGGEIQQLGTPDAIYDTPANLFVAGFVGAPAMNFLSGTVQSAGPDLVVDVRGTQLALPKYARTAAPVAGQKVVLGIRPERLNLDNRLVGADCRLTVDVDVQESLGSEKVIWARYQGQQIAIKTPVDAPAVTDGAPLELNFSSANVSLFDADTETRL